MQSADASPKKYYSSAAFGNCDELKFELTPESKDLFAKARDGQGFAVVGWREKGTNIVRVALVPSFVKDSPAPRSYLQGDQKEVAGTRVGHREWVYRPEDKDKIFPYVESNQPDSLGSGVIHEMTVEYLKKTGQMPKDLEKTEMFGAGLWKGFGGSLLRDFRNRSANLNNHSIKWDEAFNLACYYTTGDVDTYIKYAPSDDPMATMDFILRRTLPGDLTAKLYDTLLKDLPNEQKKEPVAEKFNAESLYHRDLFDIVKKININDTEQIDRFLLRTAYVAVCKNNPDILKKALTHITNKEIINQSITDQAEKTLLTATILYGSIHTLETLLECGVAFDKDDSQKMKFLMISAEKGKEDIFKFLLKMHEKIDMNDLFQLLVMAIKGNNKYIIAIIMQEIKLKPALNLEIISVKDNQALTLIHEVLEIVTIQQNIEIMDLFRNNYSCLLMLAVKHNNQSELKNALEKISLLDFEHIKKYEKQIIELIFIATDQGEFQITKQLIDFLLWKFSEKYKVDSDDNNKLIIELINRGGLELATALLGQSDPDIRIILNKYAELSQVDDLEKGLCNIFCQLCHDGKIDGAIVFMDSVDLFYPQSQHLSRLSGSISILLSSDIDNKLTIAQAERILEKLVPIMKLPEKETQIDKLFVNAGLIWLFRRALEKKNIDMIKLLLKFNHTNDLLESMKKIMDWQEFSGIPADIKEQVLALKEYKEDKQINISQEHSLFRSKKRASLVAEPSLSAQQIRDTDLDSDKGGPGKGEGTIK